MSFGKLFVITRLIREGISLPAVYIEQARNMYKITLPDGYIVDVNSPMKIYSGENLIYPAQFYSAGYFTLPIRMTSVTFSGILTEIKEWGSVENINVRKFNIAQDAQFFLYQYEFELLELKVTNDFEVSDRDEVFADLNFGKFNIKSKCMLDGNVLKPSENILIMIRR